MPDDRDREDRRRDRVGETDDGTRGHRWGFRLPPIRLPTVHLPPFGPIPGRARGVRIGGRRALAVAALIDVGDAAAALAGVGDPFLRAIVVLAVAVALVGRFGLLTSWEVGAVLLGVPRATVVPSVLAVVVLRGLVGGKGEPQCEDRADRNH